LIGRAKYKRDNHGRKIPRPLIYLVAAGQKKTRLANFSYDPLKSTIAKSLYVKVKNCYMHIEPKQDRSMGDIHGCAHP
jgi:hypothetical protein